MRKMMMGLVALGAIGCGGESGEDVARSVFEAQDDGVRFECGCAWEALEFSSEAECVAENTDPNSVKQCLVRAFGPVAETNLRHVKCIRDALEDIVSCIERVGCAGTDAQYAACQAAVADRCGGDAGSEDICFGLMGEARSECLAEAARAEAVSEACFPDE